MSFDNNEEGFEGLEKLYEFSQTIKSIKDGITFITNSTKQITQTSKTNSKNEENENFFSVLQKEKMKLENLKEVKNSIAEKLSYFSQKLSFFPTKVSDFSKEFSLEEKIEEEKREKQRNQYLMEIEQLEDTIQFFQENEIFEKETYLNKYQKDKLESFGTIRDYVCASLKQNIKRKKKKKEEVNEKQPVEAIEELKKFEMNHLNFKFKNRKLKAFTVFLKKRTPEIYFMDIFACYYGVRYNMMFYEFKRVIKSYKSNFVNQIKTEEDSLVKEIEKKKNALREFIVNCLTLLLKVIEQEEELFQFYFFDEEEEISDGDFSETSSNASTPLSPSKMKFKERKKFTISPLIKSYCSIFYEELRYLIVYFACENIGLLCEILRTLKSGFINKNKKLDHILIKVIDDLENLIYQKSLNFISKEVAKFPLSVPIQIEENSKKNDGNIDILESQKQNSMKAIEEIKKNSHIFIQLSKKLLSKIHNEIGKLRFEKIVQESIIQSSNGIITFSKLLSKEYSIIKKVMEKQQQEMKQKENEKEKEEEKEEEKIEDKNLPLYVEVNVLLFLLDNLLKFREVISIYNVSFTKTEIAFNFSHIGEGIINFLKGNSSFSFKTIIFDVFANSQPKISYKKIQTRKNLDNEIKTVCEHLILYFTKFCFNEIIQTIKNIKDGGQISQEGNSLKSVDLEFVYNSNLKKLKSRVAWINYQLKENLEDKKSRNLLVDSTRSNFEKVYSQYLEIVERYNNEQEIEEKKMLFLTLQEMNNVVKESFEIE